jgi:hypothetical protein
MKIAHNADSHRCIPPVPLARNDACRAIAPGKTAAAIALLPVHDRLRHGGSKPLPRRGQTKSAVKVHSISLRKYPPIDEARQERRRSSALRADAIGSDRIANPVVDLG